MKKTIHSVDIHVLLLKLYKNALEALGKNGEIHDNVGILVDIFPSIFHFLNSFRNEYCYGVEMKAPHKRFMW